MKVIGGDYDQYGLQGAINIPLIGRSVLPRRFFRHRATRAISTIISPIRPPAFPTPSPAKGRRNWRGASRSNGRRTTLSACLLRADLSEEHDTGSTYHDLGYFVGTTLATGNKPSICNIPGACAGFTDFLGHQVAPYFTTVTATSTSSVNTAPAAYNSLINSVSREQTEGFWSTEQSLSNADVGHYHTVSAVADKTLGDIDVKLLGAYRWFDSFGSSNSRGLSYDTTNFSTRSRAISPGNPNSPSMATRSTTASNGPRGLFFFEESSPDDGGYRISVPAQRRLAASPYRRQADHRYRLGQQWRTQHQLCGLCPRHLQYHRATRG